MRPVDHAGAGQRVDGLRLGRALARTLATGRRGDVPRRSIGLAVTQFMKGILFGVNATDPLTFLVVASFLGTVAALASYLPAWRATRIDPTIALRYE